MLLIHRYNLHFTALQFHFTNHKYPSRIPEKVSCMNLETTRLRGRQRNRRQDKVREDGRLVGGKGWEERVYNG
jgi:hypothetical protein